MSTFARLFNLHDREAPAVLAGLLMFFLLFTGYFMLRPVRETMGVAGGVDNLQWLFTGTFVATLAVLPLFGWLASRVARRRIMPWAYAFFVANLLPALVGVALGPYVFTTFFGIMPGTVVYTWVGAGLGEVFARGDTPDLGIIFEPMILGPILGLCALALLPIVIRAVRGKEGV